MTARPCGGCCEACWRTRAPLDLGNESDVPPYGAACIPALAANAGVDVVQGDAPVGQRGQQLVQKGHSASRLVSGSAGRVVSAELTGQHSLDGARRRVGMRVTIVG